MRRWERKKEHPLENYLLMLIQYLFLVSKNCKNNLFSITGSASGIQSYQRTYHVHLCWGTWFSSCTYFNHRRHWSFCHYH